MAILRVDVKSQSDKNQFVSIVNSLGIEFYDHGDKYVPDTRCVWSNSKIWDTRDVFPYDVECIQINKLYNRLAEV